MNKQELIEAIQKESTFGRIDGKIVNIIRPHEVFDLIGKLEEPKKVKIPQFASNVIEEARENSPELEDALHYAWDNGIQEFTDWYGKKLIEKTSLVLGLMGMKSRN